MALYCPACRDGPACESRHRSLADEATFTCRRRRWCRSEDTVAGNMDAGGASPAEKGYKRTRNSIMQSGIERELTGDLPFPGTFVGGHDMAASSDAEQKFERVKTQLKARLGAEVYSSWFGRMKVAEASRGIVRISVPTAFLRSWINGHYLDLIAELWKREDPEILKIEIVVRTATRPARNGVEPEAGAGAQDDQADADRTGRRHGRAWQGGAGARPSPRHADRGRVPAQCARFAARPALHFRLLHRRSVEPGGFRCRQGRRGIAVERGALQSALPSCNGRARQDPPFAGDRGRIAASRIRSRASSI